MTYCVDNDLLKYRSNILSLGVTSFQEQREEAYSMINRVISTRWYRRAAIEKGLDPNITEFDPIRLQAEAFKRLECFKTLELIYLLLKKDNENADGFERFESSFRSRYNEELELILAEGIDYDWSGGGLFGEDEKNILTHRRLVRG